MTDQSNTDAPVEGSVHAVSVRDGNQTIQVQPEPISDIANSKGVLATATDHTGGTIAGRPVTETDIVTIKTSEDSRGVQMSVKEAVTHGLLTLDETGKFVDVTDEAARKALDGGKAADEERRRAEKELFIQEHGVPVDQKTENTVVEFMQTVEAAGMNSAAALATWISDPSRLPEPVENAVREAGGDPVAMHARATEAYQDIEDGIAAVLIDKGLPANRVDHFWQWARDNKMHVLRQAAVNVFFNSDTRPYVALMKEYEGVYGFPTKADADAVTVRGEGRDRQYVMTKHGRVEREAARKMGLI